MKADSGMVTHAAARTVGFGVILCFVLLLSSATTQRAAVSTSGQTNGLRERTFSYQNEIVPEKPWSIHVIKVDRMHPGFTFYTTMGRGNSLGMGLLSDQLRSVPGELGQPVAAINGDFYDKAESYEGRPRDVQISSGEVVSNPSGHTSFWMDKEGQPHMTNVLSLFRVVWADGKTTTPVSLNEAREDDQAVLYSARIGPSTRTSDGLEIVLVAADGPWLPLRIGYNYRARVEQVRTRGDTVLARDTLVLSLGPKLAARLPQPKPGDTLQIITETVPDLSGADVAIGGGPALVRDRQVMDWKGYMHMRHPRTALGWNNKHFFLVCVDGRQSDSVGMTFQELAEYLARLGCEQAMNLDGGGSATLWALGAVRNHPSEGQERPSPNALVLVRKKEAQAAGPVYAGQASGLSRTNDLARPEHE